MANEKKGPGMAAVPVQSAEEKQRERLEHQRHLLLELAENAKNLAQRLGYAGVKLSRDEERLLRMAQLPMLAELFEELSAGFVLGMPAEDLAERVAHFVDNQL